MLITPKRPLFKVTCRPRWSAHNFSFQTLMVWHKELHNYFSQKGQDWVTKLRFFFSDMMWICMWIKYRRQLETKAKVKTEEDLKVKLKKLHLWWCLMSALLHTHSSVLRLVAKFPPIVESFHLKSYFMVLQQNQPGHGVRNTPWLNSL